MIVGTFARHPAAAIVAGLGVVLAAIYVLWTYQRMFTGPDAAELAGMPDLRRPGDGGSSRRCSPLMVVFGFVPGPALDLVRPPASVTLEQVGVPDVPAAHRLEEGATVTDFVAPTIDWAALSPVVIVLLAAVVGVLVEAFVPARVRRTVQLALALAALAGAARRGRRAVERRRGDRRHASCSAVPCWSTARRSSCRRTIALLALVALLIIADRTETGEDAFAPERRRRAGLATTRSSRAARACSRPRSTRWCCSPPAAC